MTGAAQRKGDWAEREAADTLSNLLTKPVRRLLGAGRADDVGDLDGVPRWVVQVAWWPHDMLRAVREKVLDAETQASRSGMPHAVAMVRLRKGVYRMVMTPEGWAAMVNENERLRRELADTLRAHNGGVVTQASIVRAGGYARVNPSTENA